MKKICPCYVCKAHRKIKTILANSTQKVSSELIEFLDYVTEDLSTTIGMNEYKFSATNEKPKVVISPDILKNYEQAIAKIEDLAVNQNDSSVGRILNYYKSLISKLNARLNEQFEADTAKWLEWKGQSADFFKEAYENNLA